MSSVHGLIARHELCHYWKPQTEKPFFFYPRRNVSDQTPRAGVEAYMKKCLHLNGIDITSYPHDDAFLADEDTDPGGWYGRWLCYDWKDVKVTMSLRWPRGFTHTFTPFRRPAGSRL